MSVKEIQKQIGGTQGPEGTVTIKVSGSSSGTIDSFKILLIGMDISSESISMLLNLRFSNGRYIISLDDNSASYEIANLIASIGAEKAFQLLQSKSFRNIEEIIFSSSLFEQERKKLAIERDLYKNKTKPVSGVFKCRNPKCDSDRTYTSQKQIRSPDEPVTTFVECAVCGEKWRI